MGVPVKSTDKLVVQVHYNLADASNRGRADQTKVRLRLQSAVERVGFFDLADKKLAGLKVGCRIEFEARPEPTILCHSPRVQENLPSAVLLRMESSL